MTHETVRYSQSLFTDASTTDPSTMNPSITPQIATLMANILDAKRTPLRSVQKNSLLPDSSCQALRAKIDAYRKRTTLPGETPLQSPKRVSHSTSNPTSTDLSNPNTIENILSNENYDKNLLNISLQEKSNAPDHLGNAKMETIKALNSTLRKQLNEKNNRVQVLEKLLASQTGKIEEYNRIKEDEQRNAEWLEHIQQLQNRLALCDTTLLLKQERESKKSLKESFDMMVVFQLSNELLEEVHEDALHMIQMIESSVHSDSVLAQFAKMTLKQIVEETELRRALNDVSGKCINLLQEKDLALREEVRLQTVQKSVSLGMYQSESRVARRVRNSIQEVEGPAEIEGGRRRRWSVFKRR